MNKQKFSFGTEFQEAILHYIIYDKNGFKALDLCEDYYFTLIAHHVIAHALKIFYKKKKRIPSKPVLKEVLRDSYNTKKLGEMVLEEDKQEVDRIIERLYNNPLRDADEILENVVKFARYVNVKSDLEDMDPLDYNNYNTFASKIQTSINIGNNFDEDDGTFLVKDFGIRRYNREEDGKFPTPYWQINNWLTGGGLSPASLVVIASEAKRFKTGFFINLARGYMRMKKKVVIFDFENGEKAFTTRAEQSMMRATQPDLLSGVLDDRLAKVLRKYKRLGAEIVIKRFPAYKTTSNDLQAWMDMIYLKYGIKFDQAIVDYADLMGATSGRTDDDKRISDVYVDLKNLAADPRNNLETIWTASHVTREGAEKRRKTKYVANDLSKAIDKIRHCDLAIGLQETDEEVEAGVMRAEVMDGRETIRNAHALFWIDIALQNLREFTKAELNEYHTQIGYETKERKTTVVKKKSDL